MTRRRLPPKSRMAMVLWSSWLALLSLGCRGLEEFELAEHEAFCGALVSAPLFHEGLIPSGVPPALRLRLELDVKNLAARPGTVTTDDFERGLCSDAGAAFFEAAPLRTVAEALHDPISMATFGEGREHNVLTYVDSSCGHSLFAVLSLMKNGGVEMRVFKPAPEPTSDTPSRDRPGFGLFVLERQRKEDCGF